MDDDLGGMPESVAKVMRTAAAQRLNYSRPRMERPPAEAEELIPIEVVVVGNSGDRWKGKIKIDKSIFEHCAGLDHSDTDNAKRLLAYHEGKILVVAQEQAKEPTLAVWDGRRWDYRQGREKATALAQEAIHNAPAFSTVTLSLSATWTPSLTSTRAFVSNWSASFLRANDLRRRTPFVSK